MDQLRAWSLTGSREQFRQGATAFRNGRDLAKEWRNGFISAANEIVGSQNVEPSTVEASNYSRPSDNIDMYIPEESDTLADELALTSSSYPVEEPESSANKLAFASFLQLVEVNISADELDYTTFVKPAASKRRLSRGSKTISKDPRNCTSTSNQRRQSKK